MAVSEELAMIGLTVNLMIVGYEMSYKRLKRSDMDRKEAIEIPFGAKDSELKGWEYTIPEGMEAVIEDGKIIVRQKESEDERIRKWIIDDIRYNMNNEPLNNSEYKKNAEKAIAWLEKQGEQNPAWSEEDDINLGKAIWYVENPAPMIVKDSMLVEWLKSLKERYTWKPSDKQIMALRWVLNHIPYDSHKEEINGLLEQLLKLYNCGQNR